MLLNSVDGLVDIGSVRNILPGQASSVDAHIHPGLNQSKEEYPAMPSFNFESNLRLNSIQAGTRIGCWHSGTSVLLKSLNAPQ